LPIIKILRTAQDDEMETRVRYEVTVTPVNEDAKRRFVSWMEEEHAADLLRIDGCLECRVLQRGEKIRCEYTFATLEKLGTYLEVHASALRGKAAVRFKDGELQFERAVYPVLLSMESPG
jgi:hypothetical protein